MTLLIVSILIYRLRTKNNEDILLTKGIPSIGTVTESSPPAHFGGAHTNFEFNTKEDQRIYISGFKRPNNKIKEGNKYMVLYLPEKPKTAIMLFDYPINDSSDFRKFVKEFE